MSNELRDVIYAQFNAEHLQKTGKKFTDYPKEYQLKYLKDVMDGKSIIIEESEELGSIRWKKPMGDNDDVSLENFDIMELLVQLPSDSIDLILMDLPYGTTSNKWDILIPTEPLFEELNRVIKSSGNIILTCNTWFTLELGYHAYKMGVYTSKFSWIKNHNSPGLNAKHQPLRQTEDVLVLRKKGSKLKERTYNPLTEEVLAITQGQIEKIRTLTRTDDKVYPQRSKDKVKGYPRDVLLFNKAAVIKNPWDNGHFGRNNTQKPVDLLMYLIYLYSNPGDIVMDGTMGAGSTGVASVLAGRRFLGNDLQESYIDITKTRLAHIFEGLKYGLTVDELIKEDMMRYLNQK